MQCDSVWSEAFEMQRRVIWRI